ncbi:unnamed protein product [Moneuplotes crassus]|uniref:Uncharacterized protein n=1 Tax=Euplotes crassus TaxID=5936 RepID=A0AAD2D3Q0_EUPCR|nr:unnamed protein product [Moneuplotes crassus]
MEKYFRRTQTEWLQLHEKLLQDILLQYGKRIPFVGFLNLSSDYQGLMLLKKVSGLSLARVFNSTIFEMSSKSIKTIKKVMSKSSNVRLIISQIRGSPKTLNSQKRLLPALSKLSLKMTNKISLSTWNINQKQLKRIFSAVRSIPKVEFVDCTIALSSTPDFTKCFTLTKICKLRFIGCGSIPDRGWEEHPEQFEYLMSGLSTSGLKNSLKTFSILWSNLTKEYLMRVISKYEFDNIRFGGDIYIPPTDYST